MDGRTDGRTDGWTNVRIDGRTDVGLVDYLTYRRDGCGQKPAGGTKYKRGGRDI